MDISSNASVSSFYEPPEEYDEDKTRNLYQQLKKNLQDVDGLLKITKKGLLPIQRQGTITSQLINKIQSAKPGSDGKKNEKEETEDDISK